jgi:salicylate hydroxylase
MTHPASDRGGLTVIIVGAGIGGLAAAVCLRAAGHQVTVLEQAPAIGEVGAGIQLAPNATRALIKMGIFDALNGAAVAATESLRRRWQDGEVLGRYPLGHEIRERFGAPYWHAHRADVHAALLTAATDPHRHGVPVAIRLGHAVCDVDPGDDERPAQVVVGQDTRFAAHLVVGADGLHSRVRQTLIGADRPRNSGDVAYRALIPAQSLATAPRLAALTRAPALNIWLGPRSHLVHYYVRQRALLNLVAIVPANGDTPESWSAGGDKSELLDALDGWDSAARALVHAAPGVSRSALYDREPLETWVVNRAGLLGDACHPMLPYQAQGAAQALEDALALAGALDHATPDAVPGALRRYETARQPRAAAVQRASRHNRELFHLPDGPAQVHRDAQLRESNGDFGSYAWLWAGDRPPAHYADPSCPR